MQPEETTEPTNPSSEAGPLSNETAYQRPLVSQDVQPVQWTASEYVAHQKNVQWYMIFALVAIVAVVLVYFVTKGDIVATLVTAVVAVLFAVAAARPPRVRGYQVLDRGIVIDNKPYPFITFKSFSVIEEGAINSISLWPLKRFTPALSVYYPPEQEEQILNAISQHLPFEQRSADAIDKLMRKLHF